MKGGGAGELATAESQESPQLNLSCAHLETKLGPFTNAPAAYIPTSKHTADNVDVEDLHLDIHQDVHLAEDVV